MGTSSKNYYLIFERLKKLGLSDNDIIKIVKNAVKSDNLELDGITDDFEIKTLYQLLWLLYVRGITVDKKFALFIPMYFDMIKAGGKSLNDLKDHLILAENTSYEPDFDIDDIDLKKLKSQVLDTLTKIKTNISN